jgi:hypothetical protein
LSVPERIFAASSSRWRTNRTRQESRRSDLSASELSHAPSPLNSHLKSFFAKGLQALSMDQYDSSTACLASR